MAASVSVHFNQALAQSLVWTIVVFICSAALVAVVLAQLISKRILAIQSHAARIASGDWGKTMPVHGDDELAMLVRTLNEMSVELEHQASFRKDVLQDIAHELRTPLSTLKAHIEAFVDGYWQPTTQRLESCLEELNRFQSLIVSVETLYEADTVVHYSTEQVDVNMVIRALYPLFQSRCEKHGIELCPSLGSQPAWICADGNHISQIVWNLLDNAVKFTPPRHSIYVAVENTEHETTLTVRNTGIGIQKSDQEKIFERFYRVEKSRNRKTGGSGLGLAIVKKLVDLSGGSIEVRSEPQTETRFVVRWPSVTNSAFH